MIRPAHAETSTGLEMVPNRRFEKVNVCGPLATVAGGAAPSISTVPSGSTRTSRELRLIARGGLFGGFGLGSSTRAMTGFALATGGGPSSDTASAMGSLDEGVGWGGEGSG